MLKRTGRGMGLAVLLFCAALLTVSGCAKKKLKAGAAGGLAGQESGIGGTGDPRLGQLQEEGLAGQMGEGAGGAGMEGAGGALTLEQEEQQFVTEDIYFDYDSSALSPAGEEILRRKASYLQKNMDLHIIIEGHTDERGTVEYNLALGDRRAEAAKSFLLNNGIAGDRIITISYGEERPMDPGHGESAWAKNRRAHFVLQ